jgi:hypothetical protein
MIPVFTYAIVRENAGLINELMGEKEAEKK